MSLFLFANLLLAPVGSVVPPPPLAPPPPTTDSIKVLPTPKAGTSVMSFVVTRDGAMTECNVGRLPDDKSAAFDSTPVACWIATFDGPYLDEKGNPVRKLVTITRTVTIGDVK